MLDLLKDSIEGLSKTIEDDILNINLSRSLDTPLFIDWKDQKQKIKIILGKNVEIKLLEINACEANCEYFLDENSTLINNLISLENGGTSKRDYIINKNAVWKAYNAELSLENVDMKVYCTLLEEGSKGSFNLSVLSKNKNTKLFDINFIHEASNSISEMKNYGVVQDEASLKFLGIGHVKKHTQATKASQSAKIMVFDSKCKASASPILKIDDNDTNASHGASVGKINDEHLFYLMSRGIDENTAKRLITLGYLNPILPYFFDKEIMKKVEQYILERV